MVGVPGNWTPPVHWSRRNVSWTHEKEGHRQLQPAAERRQQNHMIGHVTWYSKVSKKNNLFSNDYLYVIVLYFIDVSWKEIYTRQYGPCCIKSAFERKSEISNANWFFTNQNRTLRTCVWFFWFAFKRKFYATGPWSLRGFSHKSNVRNLNDHLSYGSF